MRILLVTSGVLMLLALASCGQASTPETGGAPEMAAPAEQAAPEVQEAAPAAETGIQGESRLKEPESAAPPAVFSLEQANPFPPQDVIPEVGYFGGSEPGFCSLMSVDIQPLEVEACPSDRVEQMGFLSLLLTGLKPREAITLTTTFPEGNQISETLTASGGQVGMIRHEYSPDLADPAGEYLFTFHTSQGEIEKKVTVTRPSGTKLYLLPDSHRLLLVNFEPGERVRLFLYRVQPGGGLVMRSWSEYTVDPQGALTVDYPSLADPYFYAVGESSGLAPYQEKGASNLRQMWPGGDIACPGAPPPLPLTFDSTVSVTAPRVVAEIDSYPQVFSFPIPEGTKLTLEYFWGSPRCEDGMIWWAAECPRLPGLDCQQTTRVWIPEGRGSTYAIQPAQP